jgi:DNA uptake protein ComE-like DNA-binding protein
MNFLSKKLIKQYLAFSQSDRNAVVTLVILIFIAIVSHIVVDNMSPAAEIRDPELETIMNRWPGPVTGETSSEESTFSDRDSSLKDNSVPVSQTDCIGGKRPDRTFDPNNAGRDLLLKMGFNSFQSSNIIKYREKGGNFYKKEDLLKIYGVDSAFFESIKDYISIERADIYENTVAGTKSIELNSSDSTDLIQLRGIGPVFASRIVKFRNILGGFYSADQLMEVYNFPEETFQGIKSYLRCDTALIRKMRLNFADFAELIRHPYLERDEVNSILNFREENGPFVSKEQLIKDGLVDSLKFQKIKHYISCR